MTTATVEGESVEALVEEVCEEGEDEGKRGRKGEGGGSEKNGGWKRLGGGKIGGKRKEERDVGKVKKGEGKGRKR